MKADPVAAAIDPMATAPSALRANLMGIEEVKAPEPDAWRFDLWCMAACLALAGITFLAIYLKTGSL